MADNYGSSENGNTGNAYADALARARQIAAKLGAGTTDDNPLKRPLDGGLDSQPDAKKMATNDHINTTLQNMASQPSGATRAAQLAAAAASQINAKLGVASAGPAPPVGAAETSTLFGIPFGPAQSEVISVPDRMVGLLIGKGGEQIASIQNETECRIQFAPDSGGLPTRQTTLTGTASAIQKAKDTIQRLVAKLQGGPLDNDDMSGGGGGGGGGQTGQIELMVPGGKVGLIIGKGGETIKQLQERAGVKIVVIQDSNAPTSSEKPVRITGDRQSCLRAKDMLLDLLAQKDMETGQFNYGSDGGYGNGGQGGGKETVEVPVPRNLIGVIIGKSGDMIKKIQEESGCRVQFKPEDEDMGGPTRICTISGNSHGNQIARNMILELIDTGLQKRQGGDMMGGGMGRGRGRGRGMEGGFGGDWPPGGGQNRFDGTTYVIPADKCGLVIGKGGETIREINRQSGAHCELSRDPPPNQHERIFRIQGSPEQVQTAIRLINEKTGQPQMPDNSAFRGPPGHPGPMGGPPQMGVNPYGPPNPQGMPHQQQMQPPHQQPGPQPGQMPQPGMMPQQPQYGAPQPWGAPYQNPYGQMAPAPAPGVPDPNKQAADANAAAWAAYYAQIYGQAPVQQPQQPQQQPQAQQQPAVGAYGAPAAPAPAPAQPQPTINPQTGQPDYSAAWAEYYRQQGMHQHAAAIMQASQQSQAGHPGQQ